MKHLFLILFLMSTMCKAASALSLGVYDFDQAFLLDKSMAIESQYVSWTGYVNGTIQFYIEGATSRNRWLLLTVQPNLSDINLLNDITAGLYDSYINQEASEINAAGQPLFIRFAQQMDTTQARYPWSGQPPATYIAAFQHYVTLMRSLLKVQAYFIWGPGGNSNCTQYWVGSTFCDVISFDQFSYREYDIDVYGAPQTFITKMNTDYHYAYVCDPSKSVMLAECGAYSDNVKNWQSQWIQQIFHNAGYYSQFKWAVWFNAPDSVSWGYNLPIPNFETTPSLW